MPQLDITTYSSQLVWLVITFTVLYVVMSKVIVPKIASTLEARKKRMDDNLAQAAQLKEKADAAQASYEEKLVEARDAARTAIAEVRASAQAERTEAETALAAKLSDRIKEAEATIAKAKDDALANMRDMAVDVAASVAEKVVGEAPDASKVGSAVDGALKADG
ncbi:MAG: F0F1 ATP synthase subunit B' [Magnetovibrionaceae bacterium]